MKTTKQNNPLPARQSPNLYVGHGSISKLPLKPAGTQGFGWDKTCNIWPCVPQLQSINAFYSPETSNSANRAFQLICAYHKSNHIFTDPSLKPRSWNHMHHWEYQFSLKGGARKKRKSLTFTAKEKNLVKLNQREPAISKARRQWEYTYFPHLPALGTWSLPTSKHIDL